MSSKNKQFSQIPCAICGSSSSGYHFGAISCESCKVFFCRSLKRPCLDQQNKAPYLHRCNGPSSTSSAPSNCQRCRFDKCLSAGMSLSSVCIGRHSAERRLQKTLMITKLAEKNQLLQGHISRRRSTVVANDGNHEGGSSEINHGKVKKNPIKIKQPQTKSACPVVEMEKIFSETSCPAAPKSCSVPLINECNVMPQAETASNVEQLIQHAVASVRYLNDIRTMPCISMSTPDMTTEAISATMMVGQEAYTEIVRRYVRSLPGFTNVTIISDRIRLFNGAYHPLYSTQLALDYDMVAQVPRFFSVDPGISQSVILQRFPELMEVFHQFNDSGVAITSAQFTRAELALLCALIFFNPYPQPHLPQDECRPLPPEVSGNVTKRMAATPCNSRLQDAKRVQAISTKYWQATERYIRSTFPPETASKRLSVFSELLTYFRNTSLLMHQISIELVETHPWLLKQSKVFEDIIVKLINDNVQPKRKIAPDGVIKFEPKVGQQ